MPDAHDLTLCQRLTIALVPASVPALVLVIALGLATLLKLNESLDALFEQVAGGALLITYIKDRPFFRDGVSSFVTEPFFGLGSRVL